MLFAYRASNVFPEKRKKLFSCRVQCCIICCANQAKHKARIPFCSTYARIEQQGAQIAFTRIAFWLFSKISLTFRRQDIYRRRITRYCRCRMLFAYRASNVFRENRTKKKLFCCHVQCCIISCANQAEHKAGIPFVPHMRELNSTGLGLPLLK